MLKVGAACFDDIDWRPIRGLDIGLIATLAGGDWLRHARNLLITGATGSGKRQDLIDAVHVQAGLPASASGWARRVLGAVLTHGRSIR